MNSTSISTCEEHPALERANSPSPTVAVECDANACASCACESDKFGQGPGEKVVCHCFQVTESAVIQAIETFNLSSVKDLCRFTNAGAGCTACRLRLKKYLQPKTQAVTASVAAVGLQ